MAVVGNTLITPAADYVSGSDLALWASALGSFRNDDGQDADVGYDTRLGGLVVGGDGQVTEGARVGAFAGAAASWFRTDSDSQSIDAESYFGGLYAGLEAERVFLDIALTAGLSRQSSDRKVLNNMVDGGIEHAEADYDGLFISPSATLGTAFSLSSGTISPSIRVRYAAMRIDNYEEDGSTADMTVEKRSVSVTDLRGQLAFDAEPMEMSGGSLNARLRGGADLTRSSSNDVEAEILATSLDFDAGDGGTSLRGFLGVDLSYVTVGGTSFNLMGEVGMGSNAALDVALRAGFDVEL